MPLHLEILWTTEIDGITEAQWPKQVRLKNHCLSTLGVSECYMHCGHKMALCMQQRNQSRSVSKLRGKQLSNLINSLAMQTHKGQYLPLLTVLLPDKVWSASGLPGKRGPDYGSLMKPVGSFGGEIRSVFSEDKSEGFGPIKNAALWRMDWPMDLQITDSARCGLILRRDDFFCKTRFN